MATTSVGFFRKLFLCDVAVTPRLYLNLGLSIFVIKLLLDRAVASAVFDRSWSLLNYLVPSQTYTLPTLPPMDQRFYGGMLLLATPFILIGLYLTCRRLQDAGLPRWLLVLFFVPTANLIFFLVLAFAPSAVVACETDREDDSAPREGPPTESLGVAPQPRPLSYATDAVPDANMRLTRLLPIEPLPSALVAVFAPVPVAVLMLFVGVTLMRRYGWGVFVGLPFVIGMISAALHGARAPRRLGQSINLALLSLLVSAAAVLVFGMEGLGCLIMCAPVTGLMAAAGAMFGHGLVTAASPRRYGSLFVAVFSLPMLMGAEALTDPPPAVFSVTTTVEVDASPETVWTHVVSFPDLPPPTEWIFRAGVAYPIRARIDGSGAGAIRYCQFSTGDFVEPIEVWEPGRLLKFAVTHNPPPMREWSPWNIKPPHLDNFLGSHGGQFKLIRLPDGRTRLEGTTWYQHGMSPETYWRWWSNSIIRQIHRRVLVHVKQLSERPAL